MYQRNLLTPDCEPPFIGLVVKPHEGVFNFMDMKEIWKDVPGYEGIYKASDLGNIKSLERKDSIGRGIKERILNPSRNNHGYRILRLYKNGKKNFKVSVLIAMAFHGHKPDGYKTIVDHKDNVRTNDRADNLQLITHRENCSKDRNGKSKYTGVCWSKSSGKWHARIHVNGKDKHIGYFEDELDASKAYQIELNRL